MTTWTNQNKSRVEIPLATEAGLNILCEDGTLLLVEDIHAQWGDGIKNTSTWSQSIKNTTNWTSPVKN